MSTATTLPPSPIVGTPPRRPVSVGSERLNSSGFVLACLVLMTVFVDINAAIRLMFGSQRIGSPLIFILCLSTFIAYRFQFRRGLGKAGMIYTAMFLIYLLFGTVVLLVDFSDVAVYQAFYFLQMNLSSVVIMLALAPAARNAVLAKKGHRMIMAGFLVLMASVLLLFYAKFAGTAIYATHELTAEIKSQFTAGRAIGFFTNANQAGMAMCVAAAFGFATLVGTKRRLFVMAGIAAAGVAVVATYSRSSMLVFGVVAIVQIVTSNVFKNKAVILSSLVAVSAFVWFLSSGYESLNDLTVQQQKRLASFTSMAKGDFSNENTGHRFAVAKTGIEYWLRSPVFGHGLGTGRSIDMGMGVTALGPHNQFILLLIEGGAPTLILFIIAGVVAWTRAMRCKVPQVRTLAIGCLAVYTANCFTSHTILLQNIYAAAMGIVFGCLSAADVIGKGRR